jgi:hypothetical protein
MTKNGNNDRSGPPYDWHCAICGAGVPYIRPWPTCWPCARRRVVGSILLSLFLWILAWALLRKLGREGQNG